MSFLINPYAFLAAGGDFESIATVTVGSGGAANVEFTNISGSYQHLQIRLIARGTVSATTANLALRFNGDTGNNYAYHILQGTGSSTGAAGYASQNSGYADRVAGDTATASIFGACIIDVLDYASTSKNTTARAFTGVDVNGTGGHVNLVSSLWVDTSAVTSVLLYPTSGNWKQHSTFALYGLRAP